MPGREANGPPQAQLRVGAPQARDFFGLADAQSTKMAMLQALSAQSSVCAQTAGQIRRRRATGRAVTSQHISVIHVHDIHDKMSMSMYMCMCMDMYVYVYSTHPDTGQAPGRV